MGGKRSDCQPVFLTVYAHASLLKKRTPGRARQESHLTPVLLCFLNGDQNGIAKKEQLTDHTSPFCCARTPAGDSATPRGDLGLTLPSAGLDGPDPGLFAPPRGGDVPASSTAANARASPSATTADRKRGGPASRLMTMTEAWRGLERWKVCVWDGGVATLFSSLVSLPPSPSWPQSRAPTQTAGPPPAPGPAPRPPG